MAIWALLLLGCAGLCGAGLTSASAQVARPAAAAGPARSPAAATGLFGLDLLGAGPPGNLVVSPDSVASALAMAGTGAAGPTAAQIAAVLHLRGPAGFDSVGNLQRRITAAQEAAGQGHPNAPTLAVANGLFLQQGFPLAPRFVGGLQRHFGAAPQGVDFAADPEGALGTINSWVSDHTAGIIPELFRELSSEARLVLTNAVYLRADWRRRFNPADTAPASFHGNAGSGPAEFMHQTSRLLYGSGHGYRAVELPYRASTLSLLVVLPVGSGVAALQRQLSGSGLGGVVHGLSRQTVNLSLPRFHLTTHIDLVPALESLGMTDAFSEAADFSGITTAEALTIGAVEHAADLGVDEEGTVAAAATGVVFFGKSKRKAPRDAVTFDANRPFLFFVRDDSSGATLFAGRLTNPGASGPEQGLG